MPVNGKEDMNRKLTPEECFAKAEAYQECADHIGMHWTDDPLEIKFGKQLELNFRKRYQKWHSIGRKRMC